MPRRGSSDHAPWYDSTFLIITPQFLVVRCTVTSYSDVGNAVHRLSSSRSVVVVVIVDGLLLAPRQVKLTLTLERQQSLPLAFRLGEHTRGAFLVVVGRRHVCSSSSK